MLNRKRFFYLLPLLLVFIFLFIFLEGNKSELELTPTKVIATKEQIEDLVGKINLEDASAGVFLYTFDYKSRYLLASNTFIINKWSDVENDSFFSLLLSYQKKKLCYITQTSRLPKGSSLEKALSTKKLISDDIYYMACPIHGSSGNLLGYLSFVVKGDNRDILSAFSELLFETKLIETRVRNL